MDIYTDNITISFNPKTEEKKKEAKEEKQELQEQDINEIGKSRVIAILLALFLGRYGVHKFYLGKPGVGLIYLLCSRFDIMMIFGFVDAIIYIFMSQETWLKEYGTKKHKK